VGVSRVAGRSVMMSSRVVCKACVGQRGLVCQLHCGVPSWMSPTAARPTATWAGRRCCSGKGGLETDRLGWPSVSHPSSSLTGDVREVALRRTLICTIRST